MLRKVVAEISGAHQSHEVALAAVAACVPPPVSSARLLAADQAGENDKKVKLIFRSLEDMLAEKTGSLSLALNLNVLNVDKCITLMGQKTKLLINVRDILHHWQKKLDSNCAKT